MEQKILNITEEELKELTLQQVVDLKLEIDDLQKIINYMIKKCNEALNE